jgi:acyl transferase domain-containing protein
MRRRYVYKDGIAIEITNTVHSEPTGILIMADLPGYQSPVTELWVEGRAQRREDLKRTGSRPWEGLQQEKQESARQERYAEQKLDASLTRAASEAFYQLPPSKRDILKRM